MIPHPGSAIPTGADDDETGFDEAYYEANQQDGDRIALAFYARIAARLAPAEADALDFGSGTGHFSARLCRRFHTHSYDLSPYARRATARTAPAATVLAEPDQQGAGWLDLICTLHVLEHIPEPLDAFTRFARWLRPGGRLLYVVPNPQGAGHRLRGEEWFAYRDASHCSLLERDEWLGLTREAGFRIDRAAADGLWDPPYVRRVPRLLQLPAFGFPAAAQVALGRLFLPVDWGECLVVTATRSGAS